MMVDWEDESPEQATHANKVLAPALKPAVKKKWADEEEKKPPLKPAIQVTAPKRKISVKQKIIEKRAVRDVQIADGEESPGTRGGVDGLVMKKRIERERKAYINPKIASELLGGTGLKRIPPRPNDLLEADPKTKDEFIIFSDKLMEIFIKRLQDKPLYARFVEHYARALAAPLRDVDARKVASGLATLANEKRKEQRDGVKKKKTTVKPTLGWRWTDDEVLDDA